MSFALRARLARGRSNRRHVRLETRGRRLVALVTTLVTCATLTAVATVLDPAEAVGGNSLWDNWAGQPSYDPDPISAPAADTAHAETSVAYFDNGNGPEHLMYHRRRAYVGGDPERYTIALSSSRDGTNFTYERDVITPGVPGGCYSVEAPKVLVQPGLLTMVYEANPAGDTGGCPVPVHQWVIGMAHSTDGRTWTDHRIVAVAKRAWEGASISGGRHVGNIGTPTITQADGRIYVGFHGYTPGSGRLLNRGYAYYQGTNPRLITAVNGNFDNNLVRPGNGFSSTSNRYVFQNQSGGTETRPEFNKGFGAADIVNWQPPTGGTSDGGWYMVFEGFMNEIRCDWPGGKITVAIARADKITGPWKIQDRVLLGAYSPPDGLLCGQDLPSWNVHDGYYKVIYTRGDNSASGIQRLRLWNAYRPGGTTTTTQAPTTTTTAPPPPTACNDGVDNDGDSLADLADPGCQGNPANNSEYNAWACSDGADNDQDAKWDWPQDPGCTGPYDSDEYHYISDRINAEQFLRRGTSNDMIKSPDGQWTAWMQGDGNFSLYRHFGTSQQQWSGWHTNTSGTDASEMWLHGDGNFVLYGSRVYCATWTTGNEGSNPWVRLQNDGNLVIYTWNEAFAIWDRYGYTGRSQCHPV